MTKEEGSSYPATEGRSGNEGLQKGNKREHLRSCSLVCIVSLSQINS